MTLSVDHLNEQQQEAVFHTGSPLLVLAGAGSGKTSVITSKIGYLIQLRGIKPAHIFAITFTNKAAREMQTRVGKMMDKSATKGLRVSTFHTLGLNIIRTELEALGLRTGFSIFDSADAQTLLKTLVQKENQELDPSLQSKISMWKNTLTTPAEALLKAEDKEEHFAAKVYEAYSTQLKAYNAVDFDDLIMLPVNLLKTNAEVRERWQNKIRYCLIDEYQDTNLTQYELIRLLVGVRGEFTAVGDDDQSIYAWRGARPENIETLKKDYPTLRVIKLEQNYRSTNRILQSANMLIKNNPHLHEKHLWSALGEGEKLRIAPCKSPEDEAEMVIKEIMRLQFKHKAQPSDIAILYRSNHLSRPFEKMLRDNNIPYQVSGGQSFFERSEIKDAIAYMRILTNPNDDAAFLRVVNTPKRMIGASTLQKLGDYAGQRETSLYLASGEMGLRDRLSQKALLNLERFTDWLQEKSRVKDDEAPNIFVSRMLEEINYTRWLQDISSNDQAAQRRQKNVEELIKWIGNLYEKSERTSTMEDIVQKLCLFDMFERQEDEKKVGVWLMTMHAAKGLEYPFVFMVGTEEELLPHKSSIAEGNIEEERRLAYVGITRAKKLLTISFSKARENFGEKTYCEPSRFLEELPEEHVNWLDDKEPTQTVTKSEGRAFLAQLKNQLND